MRHRKNKLTLDRKASARKALLKTLAVQFILYEKIKTTEAKAKALRSYVEPLITRGKKNTLANHRYLKRYLTIDNAIKKLLEDISPRYHTRPGGYTRIIKLGQRQGDGAHVARIELV